MAAESGADRTTVVALDLGKSPLRVGVLLDRKTGRYAVIKGSKYAKVDGDVAPSRGELLWSYRNARDIVKSLMGEEGGDEIVVEAAVVVVPNDTSQTNRDAIALACRGERSGLNVANVRVVHEYESVAAAYADRVKPSKVKTLAIVSITGGIIDLSVISIHPRYLRREQYEYWLEARVAHLEHVINFACLDQMDKILAQKELYYISKIPIIGGIVGHTKELFSALLAGGKEILFSNPNLIKPSAAAVDAIVFVGNEPARLSLQELVKVRYPNARVWDDIDVDEIAAHGGAVLAYDSTKPPPPPPPPSRR